MSKLNKREFSELLVEWNCFLVKEAADSLDLESYLKDSTINEKIKNTGRVDSIYEKYCKILKKPEYTSLIKKSIESHNVYFNPFFNKKYISKRKQGFDPKHSTEMLKKIISNYTGNITLDDVGLNDTSEEDYEMILAHKIIKENINTKDFFKFIIENMPPIILLCNELDLYEDSVRIKDGNHRWGITEIVKPKIEFIPAFIITQKIRD